MRKNQSKKHTGYLRGRCVNSFKVPDSLGHVRKMVSKETSAVFSVESGREIPFVPGKRTKIADLHCKEISRLGGRPISIQHTDLEMGGDKWGEWDQKTTGKILPTMMWHPTWIPRPRGRPRQHTQHPLGLM